MFRRSQVRVGGQTQSPRLQDWHFSLKSLQNEAMWLPYYGLGTCGIVEMPRRAGTPASSGPTATALLLAALLCAEQVALPTQSESKNVVIWLPRAFISVAFLTVAGTKGVGVLRTLVDSGNVSLPPQIPAVLAVWNSHPSC